jgi:acetoin utilization deacetylase AcuC-like enzyme
MNKLPLVYHPTYSPPFDPKHRFPMEKFTLLFEQIKGTGLLELCDLYEPEPADPKTIGLAHCVDYIQDYRNNALSAKAIRRIGLPWTEAGMKRTFRAVGGSLLTTRLAIEHGLAAHLAGGTHHAHFNEGSGFCIFNDLVICAHFALTFPEIQSVMIIDVDVHQGDGTARMTAENPNITTVSFHCKQNFPARKATSDYDIEIEHGTADEDYLVALKSHVPYLLALHQPDFVIYDAGADVHEEDVLGLLNLTDEGIKQRDTFVLTECAERNIPVSCVIGGGYMKNRQRLAQVHSIVHQSAFNVWQEYFA